MIDAKEYLQQVKLYDCHINSKLEEKQRLIDLALKITSSMKPDVVSTSGSQDKIGDAVAKIVDLEEEINKSIDNYVDHKREVTKLIEQIMDADQLQVLQKRYLHYESLEQIAWEMNMTYRNVCYIHGRALQAVERLLKERETK
jgi:DNA-directed RNA polymerase specialized sigma subunit